MSPLWTRIRSGWRTSKDRSTCCCTLIKKSEVDIYDIPIVLITQQYLRYLELMQELDLDIAGEFLVMATTLIHIKSRMLVPRPDPAEGEEDEDPRYALIQRLMEHQKFKAAAELLHERETLRSAQWKRPDGRVTEIAGEAFEPELEVDLFSLLRAFQSVIDRAKARPPIPLPHAQISIETRIDQILAKLSETEACGFEDLFSDVTSRSDLIVTFLALLEMIPAGAGAGLSSGRGWTDPGVQASEIRTGNWGLGTGNEKPKPMS